MVWLRSDQRDSIDTPERHSWQQWELSAAMGYRILERFKSLRILRPPRINLLRNQAFQSKDRRLADASSQDYPIMGVQKFATAQSLERFENPLSAFSRVEWQRRIYRWNISQLSILAVKRSISGQAYPWRSENAQRFETLQNVASHDSRNFSPLSRMAFRCIYRIPLVRRQSDHSVNKLS